MAIMNMIFIDQLNRLGKIERLQRKIELPPLAGYDVKVPAAIRKQSRQ